MAEGGIFVINVDDSEVFYESLYDPDLKEFYSKTHLPSQLTNLEQLKIKEVYSKVLKDTQWANKTLHANFRVFIWSKFKIDQTKDLNFSKDRIERRFEVLLPLTDMDMLILNKF
jgi:hypothetical protein